MRRFAVIAAAGAHTAGRDGGPGGVLSKLLFARDASGHGDNCGNDTISVMSRTTCVTGHT
ncbi:hypothetical protein ACIBP6_31650 [Nonomuraea terrae]|uniref:hypothetical protein n=1 Tax=Nonomuraea terrae TaxID=2530383 RepID=UPI0037B0CA2A